MENEPQDEKPYLDSILKNMVLIPAGEFLMGSPDGEGLSNEHPQHRVYLDAYYIDRYEVTNAQFKEFVDATGYVTEAERNGKAYVRHVWPPGIYIRGANWRFPRGPEKELRAESNHPVLQVTWNDAVAFANWAGKRSPTEAEWEKAARGTDGRRWPWGNIFNLEIDGVTVHTNQHVIYGTTPVGQFPTGVSPYGVYDMAGNVREWVMDWYAADYYENSPKTNPKGPDSREFRVLKGASWTNSHESNFRCALRAVSKPDFSSDFIGFRCARDFTLSNGR